MDSEFVKLWKEISGFAGFFVDLDNGDLQFEARVTRALSGLGHPHLLDDIRVLAINADFSETPLLFIDRSEKENVFAEGADGVNIIIIHRKYLEECDAHQLRGIIGHEMAHLVLRHGGPASLHVPFGLKNWKYRREEKQADKWGAIINGGTEDMISFLKSTAPKSLFGRIWDRLETPFSDHPSVANRIKLLERLAVTHVAELQESKSSLESMRDILSEAFAQAASDTKPAAPPAASSPSRPSRPQR